MPVAPEEGATGNPLAPKFLYRYEAARGSITYVQVVLKKYRVSKETPSGYWIQHPEGYPWEDRQKFILKCGGGSKKRFAYEDPDRAWQSWKSRKHHHINHLTNQLRRAQLLNEIERPEFPKDSAEVLDGDDAGILKPKENE